MAENFCKDTLNGLPEIAFFSLRPQTLILTFEVKGQDVWNCQESQKAFCTVFHEEIYSFLEAELSHSFTEQCVLSLWSNDPCNA